MTATQDMICAQLLEEREALNADYPHLMDMPGFRALDALFDDLERELIAEGEYQFAAERADDRRASEEATLGLVLWGRHGPPVFSIREDDDSLPEIPTPQPITAVVRMPQVIDLDDNRLRLQLQKSLEMTKV